MRFLYILLLLSPVAWNQSLKKEYKSEELKWAATKQTYDSLRTSFTFQNDTCELLKIDINGYAADYLRRCEENRQQSLYNYSSYKTELNRKNDYGLNHLADSSVDRINNYTTGLKETIRQKWPNQEFRRFVYAYGDTTDLPKGRITAERLKVLKAKNEQLQKAVDQNKKQLLELDSLAEAYSSKLNALHELWKQYEIDSRHFNLYVFYMKMRLESLNAKPEYGAQPRKK